MSLMTLLDIGSSATDILDKDWQEDAQKKNEEPKKSESLRRLRSQKENKRSAGLI